MGLPVSMFKLLSAVILFVIGLIPALLPVLVPLCRRRKSESSQRHHAPLQLSHRGKRFVSTLACFGAGVFTAVFFLHMIGEVRQSFELWYSSTAVHKLTAVGTDSQYEDYPRDNHHHHHENPVAMSERSAAHQHEKHQHGEFPWPEFCTIMGFLLVLFMEQIVMYFHSRRHISNNAHSPVAVAKNESPTEQDKLVNQNGNFNDDGECVRSSKNVMVVVLPLKQIDDAANGDVAHASHQQVDNHEHVDLKSVMRAVVLLLALCSHAMFEGMAVGLPAENDYALAISVCMHKGIEAFCLGLSISQSGIRPLRLIILFDFLFALMSPIGIAIGMAISGMAQTPAHYAVAAILQGLASGTFLYVIFIEILPRNLLTDEVAADHDHSNVFLEHIANHQHQPSTSSAAAAEDEHAAPVCTHSSIKQADKLIKCLAFTFGIAVMALIIWSVGRFM